jgi:regulator of sigma E protease
MEWITLVFWLVGTLVVVLAPMIVVHELGHFVVAKLAGVRVEEFGLGYPPRLLRLWRGKGYLTIGGERVIIPGPMRLPPALAVGSRVEAITHRDNRGVRVLDRLVRCDPEDQPMPGQDCTVEPESLTGKLTALEPGTIYSLNFLPMGAFVRMTGEEDPSDPRSLAAQPKRWRLAALVAGPVFNIVTALIILTAAYVSGLPDGWLVRVASVEPGTAAEEAGLQASDIIVAVDGERLQEGTAELRTAIVEAPERTVSLSVLRGRAELSLAATPRRSADGTGFLGIIMDAWPDRSTLRRFGVAQAFGAGVRDTTSVIATIVRVPAMLAQGTVSPQDVRPTSMVGITGVLTYSLQQSIAWGLAFPVLQTASLISLALGLTNLLPLPALDGGRILFLVIEVVRGRRVSPEREATVHIVGLAILVGLMALVMLQDVINPIIPWSWLK